MTAQDTNSDIETPVESDSDSSLDLEIEADGVIRPFMFEPQRDTSEEDESDSNVTQEPPEAVESTADGAIQSRLGRHNWCICTNCQGMPTETESLCCQEMDVLGDRLDHEGTRYKCIIEHESFRPVCLQPDVLKTALVGLHQVRSDRLEDPPPNASMRLAGYRQFTWWTYNRLGKGNRRVIPSCVVWAIRREYPEESGIYTGYKDAEGNYSWPG